MRVAPLDVVAWIGPAIGHRAFEVGTDVHDAYVGADPGAAAHFSPLREGKWLANLPGLARSRLAARGVTDVAGGCWCTHSEAARFFSYRRDRESGRMALVAWLREA
jgi:copper oxidase (laccase) domain-containing protein